MTAAPQIVTVSKATFEASLCRASFFDFVRRFWSAVIPEPPVWNFHIELICRELQTVAERVFRREPKEYDLIINVPPGSTKSTICSEMFPAWCWARERTFRTICGSYAFPLALELASKCYRILSSDKYKEIFPEVELTRESMGLMENSQGGQRLSASTGGSVTGFHAHCIIIDDPISPKEAVSDVTLKSANEWFDHTLMSRMIDKRITPVILIQQRLHQNDPSGHALERRGGVPIRHLCLPAKLCDDVRPRSLRKHYQNGLFDPVRLPLDVLNKIEQGDSGAYAFAGQYMQSPIPLGGGMFRTDQIVIAASPGPLARMVRFWDKAGTGGRGAWTVGCLMGVGKDRDFWVLDIVRGQWEASERERIIKQTAVKDGKNVVIGVEQEPGSGGKESAIMTLRNLAGWRVRLDRPVGDKTLRAEPYSAMVNGGNVKMVRAEWNGAYLAELSYFPFSKYKDQCLVAGTLITVKRGEIPIEDVREGDMVLTRGGYRKVEWAGVTGVANDLIVLRVGEGELVGTASHLVWTLERGYIELGKLRPTDTLLVKDQLWERTNTSMNPWFSKVYPTIGESQTAGTFGGGGAQNLSIAPCGSPIMGTSSPEGTSTTKMETRSTIKSQILNALQSSSIEDCTGWRGPPQRRSSIWRRSVERRRSGIDRKRGGLGTGGMGGCVGWEESTRLENVEGVGCLMRQGLHGLTSVPPPVPVFGEQKIKHASLPTQRFVPTVGKDSKPLGKGRYFALTRVHLVAGVPVYNLKVRGLPEFFANGVLVHNCDASSAAFAMLTGKGLVVGALK